MPLYDLDNLLGTAWEFQGHWEAAEAELGAAFSLPNGTARADFGLLVDDFASKGTFVVGEENHRQFAVRIAFLLEEQLHPNALLFNLAVRGRFHGSSHVAILDPIPNNTAARAKRLAAFDKIAHLWGQIDANNPPFPGFVPPFVLANGLTLAQFNTALGEYRTALEDLGDRQLDERRARAERRDLAERIWECMVQYRLTVKGLFVAEDAIVLSLPRISPRRKRKKKVEAEGQAAEPG
jgi:hypothetical protein